MVPLIACLIVVVWAAPVTAAPLIAPVIATTLGVTAATATIIASVAVSLVSALASFALSALFRPGAPRQPELIRDLARPQSLPPYRFAYGRARVSGSPAPVLVKGRILCMCIIVNSRPSDAVEAVYLDKRLVEYTGDPTDFAAEGGAVITNPVFAGSLFDAFGNGQNKFWVGLGDQIAPPAALLSEFSDELLATDGWQGRTVIWLRLNAGPNERRAETWPRTPPEVEVLLRGCRVWNPLDNTQDPDDEATWAWEQNRALCLLDALRQNPVRPYPLAQIHLPSFRAAITSDAALVAKIGGTEPRYTANGVLIWTDRELEDQVAPLVDAGGSRLVRIGGQLGLSEGVWVAPTVAIRDVLDEGLEFERWRPGRDLATTIAATYLAPDRDWQMAAVPLYQVPGAQAADGGVEVVRDLALPMVTSPTQAQRLTKIAAFRNRSQRRIRCVVPPEYLNLVAGVNVEVVLPAPYAVMNGAYEVVAMQPRLIPEGDDAVAASAQIELLEASSTIFFWDAATEERAIAAGEAVQAQAPPLAAPVDLVLVPGESFATGEALLPAVRVTVDAPADSRAQMLDVEWRVGAGQWSALAPLEYDREAGASTASVFIVPATPGVTYEVRARWSGFGQVSEWVTDDVEQEAPAFSLAAPIGGTAVSSVAATMTVGFTLPNDPNVRAVLFYRALVNDTASATLVAGPIYTAPNVTITIGDTGLTSATEYFYWARSSGPFGALSAFSAPASATTL
jgi:hypothetical protein